MPSRMRRTRLGQLPPPRHYPGAGPYYCPEGLRYSLVYAGPSNPSGSETLHFNLPCTIGLGVPWNWRGGMCDEAFWCNLVYGVTWGPHISWFWAAPGTSAYLFQYWW